MLVEEAEDSVQSSLIPDLTKQPLAISRWSFSNACKFTQNGSITFTTRREEDGIQESLIFTVADTGIGITPAQIERLFQPFTQADSSVSRHFGATGLGLALSQGFVQMLGGTLSVESHPKVGSTFTVCIPILTVGGGTSNAGPSWLNQLHCLKI